MLYRNALPYRRGWWLYVSGAVEPILYGIVFGMVLGQYVGDIAFDGIAVGYEDYVLVGVVCAAAAHGSALDTTHDVMFRLRYLGTYRQMMQASLSMHHIVVGETLWGALRGVVYALIALIAFTAMGLLQLGPSTFLILTGLICLGSAAFAGGFIFLSTYFRHIAHANSVQLVNLILLFGSGIFFSLSEMPIQYEAVLRWSPLSILAEAARGAYYDNGGEVLLGFAVLGAAAVAFHVLNSYRLTRVLFR